MGAGIARVGNLETRAFDAIYILSRGGQLAGQMCPATSFSVAQGSIQKKILKSKLAWNKGVCCQGRAAFDITFLHSSNLP